MANIKKVLGLGYIGQDLGGGGGEDSNFGNCFV